MAVGLETFLFQDATMSDKIIIIADTRLSRITSTTCNPPHLQRLSAPSQMIVIRHRVCKCPSLVPRRINRNRMTKERLTTSCETKNMDEFPDANTAAEQIPLPVILRLKRDRLTCWFRLPRRARVAIRRLHPNMRHLPKEALSQMLRAARAPQDHINAAKHFRCQGCDNTKTKTHQRTKCHHHVLTYSITKSASTCLKCLMRLASDSRFQSLFAWEPHIIKPGSYESPSLSALHPPMSVCRVFVNGRTGWVICPKLMRCDRGTRKRRTTRHTQTNDRGNQRHTC